MIDFVLDAFAAAAVGGFTWIVIAWAITRTSKDPATAIPAVIIGGIAGFVAALATLVWG